MRRFLLLIILAALVGGCNLDQGDETPVVVTATMSASSFTRTPQPTATEAQMIPPTEITVTPTELSVTEIVQATSTPQPTFTPLPTRGPTRTPAGPPTVLPLDDGSGRPLAETGNNASAFLPVEGVAALPEPLYYLSNDQNGAVQVWRLRYGVTTADQLTFHAVGVRAFDVAPDGRVAYITVNGEMVVDGIPFLPPNEGGTVAQFTALAWSPSGDWLAYTVRTLGAEQGEGPHAVDGLWIRNTAGSAALLEPSVYGTDEARTFTGPIDWRPDGTEMLVAYESSSTYDHYSRVNITDGTETQVILLDLDFSAARWSVNGSAIIADGGQVIRIEPDTLKYEVIACRWGCNPNQAQQFANGTVTFLNETNQIVLVPAGQSEMIAVTDPLTEQGRVDFLWDNFGEQTLIVVYEPAETILGTAYLRDSSNTLTDLTPLTGAVGSPQWGAMFKAGDRARVQTLQGEALNLRSEPAGQVVTQLGNGWQLTILGGPRMADGSRWWQVQTTDGITGWAIESVTGATGLRQWTLIPLG